MKKKLSITSAGALAVVAVGVCVYAFVGCAGSDDLGQTLGVNDIPDYEGQIKKIQDNPNIPEDKKAIAIGVIRSHMTANQTQKPVDKQ